MGTWLASTASNAVGVSASHRTNPTARGPIQRDPPSAAAVCQRPRHVLLHRVPTSPPAPSPAPQLKPKDVAVGGEAAPSSSSASVTAAEAGVAFFSRARAFTGATAGRPRAWREVLDPTAFSRPESYGEARARARRNLAYFHANYALAALVLVFLGLVYRPVSMLVFLALFVTWLGLYFGRGDREPLVCLGRDIDDRVVLAVLSAATVLAVALTRAGLNLLVSLVVAAAVIGVNAAFRVNFYLDERDAFDVAGNSFTDSAYGYALPR